MSVQLTQWNAAQTVVAVVAFSLVAGAFSAVFAAYFFPSDIESEAEIDHWEAR